MSHWVPRIRQNLLQSFHSIRFRLVLWFVLILGIVMAFFSAFLYYRQAQEVRTAAIARLNYVVGRIYESSHDREGTSDQYSGVIRAFSADTTGLPTNSQDGAILALLGVNGSVVQSAGLLTSSQIQQLKLPLPGWNGVVQAAIPKTDLVETTRYLFVSPVIEQNSQPGGYLLIGVPLDLNNQLGRLLVSLVLGNVLTLAIAITGGFWLADRAMRPVRTITLAAQQISETDLHKRLNLIGRDELSELGKTFDGMLSRLQVAFERQRQFTADASHELRTPLTIIDLESNRGLSTRRSVEEYEHILSTIQSENKSMIRLVNNLLSLARMDAGQVKLKFELLDLSELTSEVIERMQPLAAALGVELQVGSLPATVLQGDRATLAQMVSNLVENAVKYSSHVATPRVNISVGSRGEQDKTSAWVKVSDNGIGISPEHLAHIFDRFYQVEPARSRINSPDVDGHEQESSGTGLGLAIAQWIARAHQGEIHVESELGQGCTFEVILPINP